MAPKKKTETKKEKEAKKETKETKSKKTSKVKITFAPIMGAAVQYKALLREKTIKKDYGREVASYVPAIEGLPIDFIVKKGEIVEVTQDQFKALQDRGHVETDEEYKARQDFIDNLSAQHPDTLSWDLIIAEGANFATLTDSQKIIYNDKLIRVD